MLPAHWPAVPAGARASRLATSRARCWWCLRSRASPRKQHQPTSQH